MSISHLVIVWLWFDLSMYSTSQDADSVPFLFYFLLEKEYWYKFLPSPNYCDFNNYFHLSSGIKAANWRSILTYPKIQHMGKEWKDIPHVAYLHASWTELWSLNGTENDSNPMNDFMAKFNSTYNIIGWASLGNLFKICSQKPLFLGTADWK